MVARVRRFCLVRMSAGRATPEACQPGYACLGVLRQGSWVQASLDQTPGLPLHDRLAWGREPLCAYCLPPRDCRFALASYRYATGPTRVNRAVCLRASGRLCRKLACRADSHGAHPWMPRSQGTPQAWGRLQTCEYSSPRRAASAIVMNRHPSVAKKAVSCWLLALSQWLTATVHCPPSYCPTVPPSHRLTVAAIFPSSLLPFLPSYLPTFPPYGGPAVAVRPSQPRVPCMG